MLRFVAIERSVFVIISMAHHMRMLFMGACKCCFCDHIQFKRPPNEIPSYLQMAKTVVRPEM